MAELSRALREYVRKYNLERAHSALAGDTPLARWEADPTPVRLPADNLGWLLRRRVTRTIGKQGFRFESVDYFATELNGLAGKRSRSPTRPTIPARSMSTATATTWPRRARATRSAPTSGSSSCASDEEDRKAASNERRKASRAQRREFERLRTDEGSGKRGARGKRSARGPTGLLGLDKYLKKDEDDG